MTKIAIVSDIHLKLRKHKAFELDRFELLVDELKNSDADIIIIDGDLLNHAVPTLEEIRAIHEMSLSLGNKRVILLAGNHEAVTKDTSTYDFVPFPNFEFISTHKPVQVEDVWINLCSWGSIKKLQDLPSADILISHYRSAMEGLYDEEVDTSEFTSKYDLVLLGDIHSRYSPEPHVHYTGSPYNIAFSRRPEEGGYVMLTIQDDKYGWYYKNLDLPRKIRVDLVAEELPSFKPEARHLYTIHLSGSLDQLSGVRDYANVIFVKYVALEDAPEVDKIAVVESKTFIDALADRVTGQLKMPKADKYRARNVLIKLQGDT